MRPVTDSGAAAVVKAFVPPFRTPTRAEAVDILRTSRAVTEATIAGLSPKQLTGVSALGGGSWSIKDLIGHLATWEERALVLVGVRKQRRDTANAPTTVDEFNAFHLERKRDWSLSRVQKDAAAVRTALLEAIDGMHDERWERRSPPLPADRPSPWCWARCWAVAGTATSPTTWRTTPI